MNYVNQKIARKSAPFAAVRRNGRMCLMTLRTGTKTPKVSERCNTVQLPKKIRTTNIHQHIALAVKACYAKSWLKRIAE